MGYRYIAQRLTTISDVMQPLASKEKCVFPDLLAGDFWRLLTVTG